MDEHPWAWAFFLPFIILAAFTALNLIIAVIVDAMNTLHDMPSAKLGGDPAAVEIPSATAEEEDAAEEDAAEEDAGPLRDHEVLHQELRACGRRSPSSPSISGTTPAEDGPQARVMTMNPSMPHAASRSTRRRR